MRLGIFEAGFYHLTQEDNTISHIYWIPIIINWKQQSVGGTIYINSDKRFGAPKEWKIEYKNGKYENSSETIQAGDAVPRDVLSLMQHFNGLFGDKISGEVEETLRPAQERSASVSIMSRNISHNIGSHVLSYLKNILSDEQDMLRAGVFDQILSKKSGQKKIDWHETFDKHNPVFIAPFLRSLGRILGYFQERQDFIGTFASDRSLYFSPIWLWEDIISNFYGKRIFEPAQKNIVGTTKNLALDFIVYSEEYQEKDINIECYFEDKEKERHKIYAQNDIQFALPAGSTGRQGVYTILENFIRNTAKHGEPKSKRKDHKINVLVTIREIPEDNAHYQVDILDNSGKVAETNFKLIEEALTKSLVVKDGNPNEQHKGIKEIQIAAGWLRGIFPHEINSIKGDKAELIHKYPVLNVNRGLHPQTHEAGLQYTFYLRRAKFALLIVKESTVKYEQDFRALKLMDWDVVSYDETKETNINPRQIYYQFILIHEKLAQVGEKIPSRIVKKSSVRLLAGWKDEYFDRSKLEPGNPDLKRFIYEMWLDYPMNGSKPAQPSQYSLVLHPHQKNWSISGANTVPSQEQLKIGIDDIRFRPNENGNEIPDRVNIEDALNQYVLFGSHLDLNLHFDLLKERERNATNKISFEEYLYVEGISGGNSTDRLLRREKTDYLWWCKMMETALTKVIIIDERAWKNYQGEQAAIERNQNRLQKKNIHILTLEYRMDNNEEDHDYLYLIDLMGNKIAKVDNTGSAVFTDDITKAQYQESHFITLHQGLLERALKHCEKTLIQEGYEKEQEQVDHLLDRFRKELLQAKFRLCIHSGRSKTHVLPRHTAFIQLSALESALRDCKLSVCELLYSSIQEK